MNLQPTAIEKAFLNNQLKEKNGSQVATTLQENHQT